MIKRHCGSGPVVSHMYHRGILSKAYGRIRFRINRRNAGEPCLFLASGWTPCRIARIPIQMKKGKIKRNTDTYTRNRIKIESWKTRGGRKTPCRHADKKMPPTSDVPRPVIHPSTDPARNFGDRTGTNAFSVVWSSRSDCVADFIH